MMSEPEVNDNKPLQGSNALLECDIVMAGGVTSGIIYPGAVAMIARRYSFKSIGGTSVGAIAAAVTAAAEYGRRTSSNPKSFEEIAAIPETLGEVADDGHSRLFHLFTPEASTKPLLTLVTPIFGGGGWFRQFARIFKVGLKSWQVLVPVLLASIAGLLIVIILLADRHGLLAIIGLATLAAFVLVVWLTMMGLMLLRHWLPAWRKNGYGICTGYQSPEGDSKAKAANFQGLTPWIHRVVQAAAGRPESERPLTFGDLWGAPASIGGDPIDPSPISRRSIELAMIASDISRNRIVQLPFLETPSPIYLETEVIDAYFPASIANWMRKMAGEYDERVERREGVIRLPKPQDLPVVFGARLSLSFPVLLSALPLMTPDFVKGKNSAGKIPLRRLWFSDGGLTSNFPIHFFDSPIPTRPTFCLNLVGFDAEVASTGTADDDLGQAADGTESGRAAKPISQPRASERTAARRPKAPSPTDPQPHDEVWGFISMAKGNNLAPVPFTAFDTNPGSGVGSFLETLLNTARLWSDNQMLIAPGIRDRVVNIGLRDDEGGLNLDMKPEVIADLDLRGRAAGLLISARFDPNCPTDPETGLANETVFANHRWVRFRNFMASFEDLSRRFAGSRRASDVAASLRGESLLEDMIMGRAKESLGYRAPSAAREFFSKWTGEFEKLALGMATDTRNDDNATFDRPRFDVTGQSRDSAGAAPRPKMRTRLRPLIDNDPRSEAADLPEPPSPDPPR